MNMSFCPPGEPAPYPPPPDPGIVGNISFWGKMTVPTWELALKTLFYAIAMLLAILGNILVLLAIAFNKKLQTTTNSYIAQLAVSDLMVGSFNMWLHLIPNVILSWPLGATLCQISIVFRILAVTASVLFLTVIALERFFSIVYPLKARFVASYVHAIIIVVTWTVAIAVTLPTLGTRKLYHLAWSNYDQFYCAEVWPRYIKGPDPDNIFFCLYKFPTRQAYYTVLVIVMYIVPIVGMTVAYSLIGHTLNQRRVPGNQTNVILNMQSRMKKKVFRMLVVVFAVFVVCYTPQQTLVLYKEWSDNASQVPEWVSYTCIYFAYFNSALNPILYGGLNENFRKGIQEIIKCKIFVRNIVHPEEVVPTVNGGVAIPCSDTITTRASPKKTVTPQPAEEQSTSSGQPVQTLPELLPPIVENCSEVMTSDEDSLRNSDLLQDDDALA